MPKIERQDAFYSLHDLPSCETNCILDLKSAYLKLKLSSNLPSPQEEIGEIFAWKSIKIKW